MVNAPNVHGPSTTAHTQLEVHIHTKQATNTPLCRQALTDTHDPLYSSDSYKRHRCMILNYALAFTSTHTYTHTHHTVCPLQTVMMACVWEVNSCLLLSTFTLDYSSQLLSGQQGYNCRRTKHSLPGPRHSQSSLED